MTKVVYVMGWWRSGTTIAGNVLGSAQPACYVGEIRYLGDPINPSEECGCGVPFADCPLWSKVPERLSFDVADWHRARQATNRLRHLPAEVRRWQRTGRLSPYEAQTVELYGAVEEVSGCRWIIDSTKSPGGALPAALSAGVDAWILHLVRDPRAVAYSLAKRRKRQGVAGRGRSMARKSEFESSLRWTAANATGEHYLKRLVPPERYRRVRYEDLMLRPRTEFGAIAEWIGMDPATLPFRSETTIDLARSHTVMGNPGRFASGPTDLVLDSEWQSGLSRAERLKSISLAAPVMARYGYPLW